MRSHLITAFGGKGLAQPPNKAREITLSRQAALEASCSEC